MLVSHHSFIQFFTQVATSIIDGLFFHNFLSDFFKVIRSFLLMFCNNMGG